MKPFNLEQAKAGKPVCTRDGRKARIVCFDRNTENEEGHYSIVALVQEKKDSNNEYTRFYDEKGNYHFGTDPYNLMMAEETDDLPTSWEEFCKNYPIEDKEYFIDEHSNIKQAFECNCREEERDRILMRTKEQAEAMLAFIQLIRLRDVYRQGWEPDWTEDKKKYYIEFYEKCLVKDSSYYMSRPLSFQSREIRDKFLDNFHGLIETAKEFI